MAEFCCVFAEVVVDELDFSDRTALELVPELRFVV
jgi:hypothetical protein